MARRNLNTQGVIPKMAIIDDYLNSSPPHFAHIPSSKLQITIFNDTIVPINAQEEARLVERLKPFNLISTKRERTAFPGSLLRQLPNLQLLLCTGTQFETFDMAAAKELGITVASAPGLGRTDQGDPVRGNIRDGNFHPTTQHTWALILALARNVAFDDAVLKTSAGWQSKMATGLTGLTIGTVGLGRLGSAVARIAQTAFNMRVVCWSENMTQQRADEMAAAQGLPTDSAVGGGKTFKSVSKEELLRTADVISMHYVLSERTRGLINTKELQMMKQSALLVNTSRGALIDQDALIDALEHGRIRGAALDTFDIEPLPASSPWRKANYWGVDGRSSLIITPHMGYLDEDLVRICYGETAENVERWLDGADVLHRIV